MIGIGDFTASNRETQWSCDEVKRTSCMGIADSDRQASGVTPLCKGHSRMRILRSFGVKMSIEYWINVMNDERAAAATARHAAMSRMSWGDDWKESAAFWWKMWSSHMRSIRNAQRIVLNLL